MKLTDRDFSDKGRYLWTDLPDASELVPRKASPHNWDLVRQFIDLGYAIRPKAVPDSAIDSFLSGLDSALQSDNSGLQVTFWDAEGKKQLPAAAQYLGEREAKVLDVHAHLSPCHPLIFSSAILSFLRDAFGEDPVAFQTLYFEYGSTQSAHNDTAFVYVDPPYKLIASWIALEDIEPNTGELFYYPGSHKVGDQIFAGGGKAFDPSDEDAKTYSKSLDDLLTGKGISRETFVPKRGDALFWSADLVHGGTEIKQRRTRRSLVTHYCPLSATVPYARHLGLVPEKTEQGGWIVSAT